MTANRWSWKQKLQYLSVFYSLFLIRIFGLWPYKIDRRIKIFKTTWFLKLQPILMGILFFIAFSVIFRNILPALNRQWKSDAANVLMKIFGTINTFFLLNIYVSVYLQTQRVKSIIVRTQEFMVKSQPLLIDDTIRTTSAILLYLLKSFVLFICFTATVCLKLYIASTLLPAYVLPFVAVPVLIIATVPNLFFGAILFATVYFERINAKVVEIVRNANLLTVQKHKCIGRTHRYCGLSDLLDEMAVLHMELTRLTQDVCKLCNSHIMSYLTFLCMNAIVQKFFLYMAVSIGLRELIAFPTSLVMTGVLNIIFIWIELIMFAHLCLTITTEVLSNLLLYVSFKNLSFYRHKRICKSYTNNSYLQMLTFDCVEAYNHKIIPASI